MSTIVTREFYLTYERVSTEDQALTKSCDDQKSTNDRYISSQGFTLANNADYRDEGRPGSSLDRAGLQDMLIRCQTDPMVKAIVVTESDRLARGNLTYLTIREALKKYGVKVIAVTQPMIDDSEEGEMLGEIFGAINGFFSKITRRKSMRALDEKANRGWYPTKAPLGYKNINIGTEEKPDRIIAEDEERSIYVRQIPTLYNQGLSYREISAKLSDEGLRGLEGGKVSAAEIQKILFSDFYLGEFIWRGVRHTGNHPPLFGWVEIQKARNRSKEKGHVHSTDRLKDKFLFKRLPLYCETDKTHITAEIKKKHYKRTNRDAVYELYHCTKSKGGWKDCPQPTINKDDLITEFAIKAVNPIDIDEELAEFMLEEMDKDYLYKKEGQDKLLHNINIRLGQVDTEMRNLFEMRMGGRIAALGNQTPEQVFEEYKLKKDIEHQKLLQARKKIEEGSKDWKQKASNFFSDCCDATNKFLHAKEDKQYLFLRRITSNVFLDNKQLIVTHQFPFSGLLKKPGCQPGLRG